MRDPRLVQDRARVPLLQLALLQPRLRAQAAGMRVAAALGPCRGKTARVINYEEFKKALEELAPKRFKDKSKEEAYEAICQLVAGKEPINVGVTVSAEERSCSATGSRAEGRDGEGWAGGALGRRVWGLQSCGGHRKQSEVQQGTSGRAGS